MVRNNVSIGKSSLPGKQKLTGDSFLLEQQVGSCRLSFLLEGCGRRVNLMLRYLGVSVIVDPGSKTILFQQIDRVFQALKITSAAKRSSNLGEIVNLMSVDAQRINDLMVNLHLVWSSPLSMLITIYFLYDLLGNSVFAGLGVLILSMPSQYFLAKRNKTIQVSWPAYPRFLVILTRSRRVIDFPRSWRLWTRKMRAWK